MEQKTDAPFFSVVIPTYNCASFLKRSLTSVFNQTFQDFEVVVIDNSSIDNSQELLDSTQDQRLLWFAIQNDGIIAASRNKGIEKAKGKWIAFLDADDVWSSEKLECVYNVIVENPNVIVVNHNEWKVVDNQKDKVLEYSKSCNADFYKHLIFKGNCLSTSAVTVRRDIALKTKGFSTRDDFITAEDYDFWIRLAKEGDFYFLDKVLGEWHVHGKNESKQSEIHANAIIQVINHHLDIWINENPRDNYKVRNARGKIWKDGSRYLLLAKEFSTAKKYASKAIYYNPLSWKPWAILFLSLIHKAL